MDGQIGFSSDANIMLMMEKVVMQVLKRNNLLTGNKTFGVVEEVINGTTLLVHLQQSNTSELVKCSPKVKYNMGDRVIVEYINNNPHDKFVMALVQGGYGTEPLDYDSLPTEPVEIIRDGNGKAQKFIYAYNHPVKRWEQELLRDRVTGKVEAVKHTYSDGFIMVRTLINDSQGRLWKYE